MILGKERSPLLQIQKSIPIPIPIPISISIAAVVAF